MRGPLLIVFAKAPVAGRAKTRLRPPLRDVANMLKSLTSFINAELVTDLQTDAWPGLGLAARTHH